MLTLLGVGPKSDRAGHQAVVVGCGLAADAEYLASRRFDTIGFDISQTAIRLASQRFPGSKVRCVTADVPGAIDTRF